MERIKERKRVWGLWGQDKLFGICSHFLTKLFFQASLHIHPAPALPLEVITQTAPTIRLQTILLLHQARTDRIEMDVRNQAPCLAAINPPYFSGMEGSRSSSMR